MHELILPDYEILSEIGRGAMGVVYKARQYSLDRFVALKILAPELARDEAYIERFKREAIIAATVVHPNIVTVYEAGAHLNLDTGERVHYFVMEYVEGETVQQRLARQERIPADEVAAIGVRVAEGLESAWKKARVIHRDIKPSNIFLSSDGDVKIGDLGLARVAGDAQSSLTATGAIIGTAYYMSPEQARGKNDVDFRSDIYSLGCALYRMLCGKHVFEGSFANVIVQHLTEPPPSIRTLVPDCPMSIVRVIEKMLAKDPSGRQQNYAELIEDLRQAHERIMFRDTGEGAGAGTAAPASRKQMTLALGGIAAVVAVTGVWWWAPWQTGDQNVGGASAPRQREAARSRGTEAVPTFQKPVEKAKAEETKKPLPPSVVAIVTSTPAKPVAKVAAITTPGVATNPPAAGGMPALPAKPAVETAPVAADPFLKEVATLPPEQQVARVAVKLKELNPNFDGKETHKIENGVVTELALSTIGVADITPLKALPQLKRLTLASASASQKGSLADLSPLRGLPLTWLYCQNNPISDLSPLRDMPLTVLSLGLTQVSDLSPLAGMKLTVLSINDTVVNDLSPLAGMPLTVLWCNNTKITDLSPLQSTSLKELRCDFVAARDAAILRGIKSLAKINNAMAAAFWLRVGPIATPTAPVTALTQTHQPLVTSVGLELVWIPAGEFLLGCTPEERDWVNNSRSEIKPRQSAIKRGFWIGRTEVTVGAWKEFVSATNYRTDVEKKASAMPNWKNPDSGFVVKDNYPVSYISWNDAAAFCEWLNLREQSARRLPPGYRIRMPAEAEWEYACRGGRQGTRFWWGDSNADGDGRLNWSSKCVTPVDNYGARGRNRFGLADMLGNVWEWCLDGFDEKGAQEQPYTEEKTKHVVRGGGFTLSYRFVNIPIRRGYDSSHITVDMGFRIVCGEDSFSAVPQLTLKPPTRVTPPPISTGISQSGQPLATSIGMELVFIPAGECMIGSTAAERFQAANPEVRGPHDSQEQFEGDQPRKVAFRQPFRMGRTEVTVGQWKQFVKATGYVTDGERTGRSFARVENGGWSNQAKGANWKKPGFDSAPQDDHPVCCISWNDAMAFCAWLDKQERSQGRLPAGCKIRLPTESEWEYACRAGQQTKYWWGDSMDGNEDRLHLKWKTTARRDSPDCPAPVDHHGERGRNKFGLADMLGNVWEWCLDGFDPRGAHAELWTGDGSQHVVKGGSFVCMQMGPPRCAFRQLHDASYASSLCGFRVACGVEVTTKNETRR